MHRMDSRRWMDVDGSWVYSTNPRRQTDNHLKYSTLPGRNNAYRGVPDMSRRPADSRGKYDTIPGRYNRGPIKDQLPFRQWSPSRLQQTAVLQDSTNWEPFLPPGTRGTLVGRFEQNADSRIRDRFWYDRDIPTRNAFEYEGRRHKLARDLEMGNLSPANKDKQLRKLLKVNSVYGEWQPEYKLENKMKASKRDEWEPLPYPPKALQNQMLTQNNKLDLPPVEKTKSLVIPTGSTSHEKKSWWSKFVKHSKSIASDVVVTEVPQEKPSKAHNDQSYLMNYGDQKMNGVKENVPQIRKRKGPPPYVPPPSYNYPHRTFLISKNISTSIQEPNQALINDQFQQNDEFQESREKLPRYSVDQWKTPRLNLLHTNMRDNRGELEKKHRFNHAHHSLLQDRKLPRACKWVGSTSDDYLDHIYEVVEGGSSQVVSNVPTGQKMYYDLGLHTDDMIYGTVAVPLQTDPTQEHTLPRVTGKGTNDRPEAIKSNNTSSRSQRQKTQLDDRPPIPLHGVKLPRELGFSYTSGMIQSTDKTSKGNYSSSKEAESYEPDDKWRKPLRVISNKESKLKAHSNVLPYTGKHGWYSHTLPLHKDYMKTYMQEDIHFPDSINKSILKQDAILPKWQEPGKISTLPSRGRDYSRWRGEDKLKIEMKHDNYHPSFIQNNKLGRSRPAIKEVPDKNRVPSSKESDGFFVIDATCVVVKAEYIFPPIMEQVTFLQNKPPKGDRSWKKHLAVPDKNETIPNSLHRSKSSSSSTIKALTEKNHSGTYYSKELSTQSNSLPHSKSSSGSPIKTFSEKNYTETYHSKELSTESNSLPRSNSSSSSMKAFSEKSHSDTYHSKELSKESSLLPCAKSSPSSLMKAFSEKNHTETYHFKEHITECNSLPRSQTSSSSSMKVFSEKNHTETYHFKELSTESSSLSCLQTSSSSTMKAFPEKNHSEIYQFIELPTERVVPNLTERAVRILGLSIGDIESLSETEDHSPANTSAPFSDRTYQDPMSHEKKYNSQGGNYTSHSRNDYKQRDCKGLPSIQEVAELSGDYDIHISENSHAVNPANVLCYNTQGQESMKIPESSTLEIQPDASGANHGNVQKTQLHTNSPVTEIDSCLPRENSLEMSHSTIPDHETAMTEQYPEEPMTTEETCKASGEILEMSVLERPVDMCILDTKDIQCSFKENVISVVDNCSEHQHPAPNEEPISKNSNQYAREGLQSASLVMSVEIAAPYSPQSRPDDKDTYQSSQTSSLRPKMKAYTRRPNYYAKDLREAVSRIRRHTAPDSDTDEDIEQSVPEPVSHEEQVPDEGVTTGSSDTSDSEVTVIMCATDMQTEDILLSNDVSDTENMNQEVTMEGEMDTSSAVVSSQDGEITAQSNNSHEHESVFDLNSCIKEILQELSKTEKEFFSSNEVQLNHSALGNGQTKEGTDRTPSE